MNLSIICFTESGAGLCESLMEGFLKDGDLCEGYGSEKTGLNPYGSLRDWTNEQFLNKDGILFIGATGIAVRAIAPFLKGKDKDPAVVVLDDLGKFSISLLSGHLGGANELAERAAKIAGAQAVLTTATDNHKVFAVDLFAKEQGLVIEELNKVKKISSAVLHGEPIGFYSDFSVVGKLPKGFFWKEACKQNLFISMKKKPEEVFLKEFLKLVPRILVLGIGCRKGIPAADIEKAVNQVFKEWNLSKKGLLACASIDIKKEEAGILAYAKEKEIPYYTYPSTILARTKGEFSSSSFVKQVTGVDNVCERAACTCVEKMGGGSLLVKKQACSGVTIAVAVRDWKVKI